MVDRATVIYGNQIKDGTVTKIEIGASGETQGYVLTVQNDGSVDWEAVSNAAGGSTFKQTFVNGDLTSDKITITHSLNTEHPQVIVYNGSDQVVLPSEITYIDVNNVELDFTGVTPISGTYKVRIFGVTGPTGGFLQTFTNGDLSSGILTVSHNLAEQYVIPEIYDNNDNIIEPSEYTATDSNTLTVDLSSYGTLTGTWRIVITTRGSGGGSGSGDSISDADNDTKIQVEESSDEDIIRFDTAGEEQLSIQNGSVLPTTDNDLDLGSSSKRFKNLYLVGSSLHLGNTHITEDGYNKRDTNIVLNAFRIAVNGSLTQLNMVDGIVDEYEDETGINTASSTNESYDSTNDLYSPLSNPGVLRIAYAHYKMNDNAASTTVTDDGVGANDGTAQQNTSSLTTTGKINEALDFNGSSDYIDIDNLQTDIASDITGSISLWVNFDVTTSGQFVFMFGDTSANESICFRATTGAKFNIFCNIAGANKWEHTSVASFSTGTWYHVMIVQDGTSPKIYVDGSDVTNLTGTSDTTTWFNDATGLDNGRIGCANFNSGGNTGFLNGQVDDFRYYPNYVLTSTDRTDLYNSGSGTEDSLGLAPYTHFKCNDTTGTTVTDDGTGANDGTANVDVSNYTITGKINTAFEFNGTSEYITTNNLLTDIISDNIGSFAFWFYSGALDASRNMITFGDTDSGNYFLLRVRSDDTAQAQFVSVANGVEFGMVSSTLTTNTWYHCVLVQDGVSPKLYINGSDDTNSLAGNDLTFWFNDSTGLDNGRIGSISINSAGEAGFFDGRLDDVRYYQNYALTSSDITSLYNAGSGLEDSIPAGTVNNMILISDSFTAQAQPDSARIILFEEDIDSVTLNTDLIAKVSRDGGTTYTTASLINEGEYESGKNILTATLDISSQPAGTSMIYKLETANNKDLNIHGTGLTWD